MAKTQEIHFSFDDSALRKQNRFGEKIKIGGLPLEVITKWNLYTMSQDIKDGREYQFFTQLISMCEKHKLDILETIEKLKTFR